jgi:hypothetical protein
MYKLDKRRHDVQTWQCSTRARGRESTGQGADHRGEERTAWGGAELGNGRTLWCSWSGTSWSRGPDRGWSRGRRLGRGWRRIDADRRAGGGEEVDRRGSYQVARLRAGADRRDVAAAQDRRDAATAQDWRDGSTQNRRGSGSERWRQWRRSEVGAAAALRELEAAVVATLTARSRGRGATIAARGGAITMGEGVFRRWMGRDLIAQNFIVNWAETNIL